MTTHRTLLPAATLTAGIWLWMVSGAWLWHAASTQDILLPQVPAAVWAVPGTLWVAAWPIHIAVLIITPFGISRMLVYAGAARILRGAVIGLVVIEGNRATCRGFSGIRKLLAVGVETASDLASDTRMTGDEQAPAARRFAPEFTRDYVYALPRVGHGCGTGWCGGGCAAPRPA